MCVEKFTIEKIASNFVTKFNNKKKRKNHRENVFVLENVLVLASVYR